MLDGPCDACDPSISACGRATCHAAPRPPALFPAPVSVTHARHVTPLHVTKCILYCGHCHWPLRTRPHVLFARHGSQPRSLGAHGNLQCSSYGEPLPLRRARPLCTTHHTADRASLHQSAPLTIWVARACSRATAATSPSAHSPHSLRTRAPRWDAHGTSRHLGLFTALSPGMAR